MRPIIPALEPVYRALAGPSYALVRIVAGGFLIPHGMWKLFGITGGTHEDMVQYFASIGIEPAGIAVYLVGVVEFAGGILIALGFFTRPAALAAAISTGVAAIYAHLPFGFYVETGGTEFASLWAVVLLMIAVRGGGRFSIDALLGREI